jgi:hypothetical protein
MGEREVSQGRMVVMGLVKPYFGSLKGVTIDNFFTSATLPEEILYTGNVLVRIS